MKEFKILIIHDNFLKDIFAMSEIQDSFDYTITSIENFKYFRGHLKNEFDLILFSQSLVESGQIELLEGISIPSVGVFQHLEEQLQLELLNSPYHIEEIIPFESIRLIIAKLNKILVRHKLENQQFEKIKTNYEEEKSILFEIDPITEIYNEQAFIKKTEQLLKDNPDQDFYILRFDIDHFKAFNENYTFKEGNVLLKAIGQKIRELSYENNVAYGHIRGDHFAICSTISEEFSPEIEIETLRKHLQWLYPDWYFTLRMGIYKIQSHDEDIYLALSRALIALYSVKNNFNIHHAFYDDSLKTNLLDEQILASEMVTALEQEQFSVYLQPQYDYATNSLMGAEALVRWIHPEKGLISPDKFIPFFENNGFITRLDLYMWEHVAILLHQWKEQHLNPVPVSVNISRRDIYELNLTDVFSSLIKKYELMPSDIRLEITESAYMENPDQLIKVVQDLQALGFQVEMDDFGSGYSSLNTLKDVPVDVLKLDMKFIRNATATEQNNSSRSGSILSSIVRMASWLQIPVIAEGIESKSQAEYLKSIGCFFMQGYYFGKPMPVDEFEKLLTFVPSANLTEDSVGHLEDIQPEYYSMDFLDATNQKALLFNSFVGGAAIIEWTGTKVEIIRVNEEFCRELSTDRDHLKSIEKNILVNIRDCCQNAFLSSLADSKKSGSEAFCEIQFKSIYDENKYFWLRTRCRHIGKTVTSDIYYFSIDNIDFRMQLLDLNTMLTEQLQSIMEYIPSGIICAHSKDNIIYLDYINEAFAKMMHSTVARITSYFENHNDYILIDLVKKELESIEDTPIFERKVLRHKYQQKRTDGTIFNGEAILQIMRKKDNSCTLSAILNEIPEEPKNPEDK